MPSLIAHSDFARHRIVAVCDGPQPEGVAARLDELARRGLCLLPSRPRREPRLRSELKACASPRRDIVLLNTDVVVTAGWLDKLRRAAYSAPRIATVTPLSNRATICSVPVANVDNDLPAGDDVDSFASLVERVATREYPRLPTGVGMCLYVKRAAILASDPWTSSGSGAATVRRAISASARCAAAGST